MQNNISFLFRDPNCNNITARYKAHTIVTKDFFLNTEIDDFSRADYAF